MATRTVKVDRVIKEDAEEVSCDHCGKKHTLMQSYGDSVPPGWIRTRTAARMEAPRDFCSDACLLAHHQGAAS